VALGGAGSGASDGLNCPSAKTSQPPFLTTPRHF
jgi:hypothetical protein